MSKNVSYRTKNVRNKRAPNEQKMLSSFVAHYCMELTCVALCGHVWSCEVLYVLMLPCTYDLLLTCVAFVALLFVILWLYIALSRDHRAKFIWSCFNFISQKKMKNMKMNKKLLLNSTLVKLLIDKIIICTLIGLG